MITFSCGIVCQKTFQRNKQIHKKNKSINLDSPISTFNSIDSCNVNSQTLIFPLYLYSTAKMEHGNIWAYLFFLAFGACAVSEVKRAP